MHPHFHPPNKHARNLRARSPPFSSLLPKCAQVVYVAAARSCCPSLTPECAKVVCVVAVLRAAVAVGSVIAKLAERGVVCGGTANKGRAGRRHAGGAHLPEEGGSRLGVGVDRWVRRHDGHVARSDEVSHRHKPAGRLPVACAANVLPLQDRGPDPSAD